MDSINEEETKEIKNERQNKCYDRFQKCAGGGQSSLAYFDKK